MPGFELPTAITEFDTDSAGRAVVAQYRNAPGFFTPYRGVGDFAATITAPVTAPLAFAVLTGLLGVASGMAAAVTITSFLAAGISAAAGNDDARNGALTVGVISGLVAVAAPLLAAISALAVVLSFIASVAAIVTRTGATAVNAIANGVGALAQCCHSEEDNHEGEMNNSPAPV